MCHSLSSNTAVSLMASGEPLLITVKLALMELLGFIQAGAAVLLYPVLLVKPAMLEIARHLAQELEQAQAQDLEPGPGPEQVLVQVQALAQEVEVVLELEQAPGQEQEQLIYVEVQFATLQILVNQEFAIEDMTIFVVFNSLKFFETIAQD